MIMTSIMTLDDLRPTEHWSGYGMILNTGHKFEELPTQA
jgi:hypothetical protein